MAYLTKSSFISLVLVVFGLMRAPEDFGKDCATLALPQQYKRLWF